MACRKPERSSSHLDSDGTNLGFGIDTETEQREREGDAEGRHVRHVRHALMGEEVPVRHAHEHNAAEESGAPAEALRDGTVESVAASRARSVTGRRAAHSGAGA